MMSTMKLKISLIKIKKIKKSRNNNNKIYIELKCDKDY